MRLGNRCTRPFLDLMCMVRMGGFSSLCYCWSVDWQVDCFSLEIVPSPLGQLIAFAEYHLFD